MIDLHTHSNRSDGTDSPRQLVKKAKAAGITVLGITDHDTTVGWAEATDAAREFGLELIRGIELSVKNGDQSQHLLAYGLTATDPDLMEMLAVGVAARVTRLQDMVEAIRSAGVSDLRYGDVEAAAGTGSTVGRPHIADVLVKLGDCRDRKEAFSKYLEPGRPTYVPRWAPPIEDAIDVVKRAGGATVFAHPWGRKTQVAEARFRELKEAGLDGIEVDHQEHGPGMRWELRRLARRADLIITGSSDHHGEGKENHDLGCNSTSQAEFSKLEDRWSTLAS